MCKTGEIGKETHFKDFIQFMKDKTIYKGWDAEQGLELLKIYEFLYEDPYFKDIDLDGEGLQEMIREIQRERVSLD